MKLTNDQIESLKKFVLEVLEDWPELGSLDGFDIQELSEKYNILIPEIRYKPCSDEFCNCNEFCNNEDWKKGVTCYRIAKWLIDNDKK